MKQSKDQQSIKSSNVDRTIKQGQKKKWSIRLASDVREVFDEATYRGKTRFLNANE